LFIGIDKLKIICYNELSQKTGGKKMGVRQILEKHAGTAYVKTLETKKRSRQSANANGLETTAREIQLSIAGYVQALKDAGIITETERRATWLYYGTI
jgi:hypothetical protein